MPSEKKDGVLTVRDDFKPNQKQQDFWLSAAEPNVEEVLFDGAIRSGKTQAACKLIAAWAWKYGGPNWKACIMRRTYRELADSTQAAFFKGDGRMPPACPPELVLRYLAKDETVILKNGAQVIFRSAENAGDTEDKIKNITMAAGFIDQVEELDGPDYYQLYETFCARLSDPRGPRKMLLVANPGPDDHWVYRRFVDEFSKEPQTRRVHINLMENEQNLPTDYIRRMMRRRDTNPLWYRRFILGEWGAFGGKRFPSWDPKVHTCEPFAIPSGWEIVQGIDYGWANATASLWCAIDFSGRWWVVAEHFEKEKPVSFHAKAMRQIEDDLNIPPSSRWLDPSTWAARSEYHSPALEFADYNVGAGKAQNDRLGGWNRIEEMLMTNMEDGRPQLIIFDRCKNLIRELPNLKIKDGTDDVEKENDHASDALRYAIMSRSPTPVEEIEEEDLPFHERTAKHIFDKVSGNTAKLRYT